MQFSVFAEVQYLYFVSKIVSTKKYQNPIVPNKTSQYPCQSSPRQNLTPFNYCSEKPVPTCDDEGDRLTLRELIASLPREKPAKKK